MTRQLQGTGGDVPVVVSKTIPKGVVSRRARFGDGCGFAMGWSRCLDSYMKLTELHLGMKVSHPQYGDGVVRSINEYAAEVQFADGRKPVDPEASALVPAEATAALSGGSLPLAELIRQTVEAAVDRLGIEKPDTAVHELGKRWRGGKLVLQPGETTTQSKEVEIEQFFHKLVMMRNQLRVLEQKINASETLTSAEKFDWQQYITRCYGSMTTFNLLFKDKEAWF